MYATLLCSDNNWRRKVEKLLDASPRTPVPLDYFRMKYSLQPIAGKIDYEYQLWLKYIKFYFN